MQKAFLALTVICAVIITATSEITFDNDHQHLRAAPDDPSQPLKFDPVEATSEFWRETARSIIQGKLAKRPIEAKAQNVVLFIADGMSPQTVAATRMYLGNENKVLSFEQFPNMATVKTYCVDRQVADDACAATAIFSGVKTNHGMINVPAEVPANSCKLDQSNIAGLLKWAQDSGMATGVVTTTRVTDATPAAAYAKATNQAWEDDSAVAKGGCSTASHPDIAMQLVHGKVGKNLKVVLGCGRRHFVPSTQLDEENVPGARSDGRNLISEWKQLHPNSEYVWNRTALRTVSVSRTDRLLGLFESSHCMYNLEVAEKHAQELEPSLSDMVDQALRMMSRADSGYFLVVEGGRIDTAHHETRPRLALDETAELAKVVELVRDMTREDETLIVVAADHGHTMTYNGYSSRGRDVLGIAALSNQDKLPYTTLSYANGPGYYSTYKEENRGERADLSSLDLKSFHTQYPATVPLDSSTHGGEDAAVYARGPMAHLFRGNMEQSVIAHMIASAAQIGKFRV